MLVLRAAALAPLRVCTRRGEHALHSRPRRSDSRTCRSARPARLTRRVWTPPSCRSRGLRSFGVRGAAAVGVRPLIVEFRRLRAIMDDSRGRAATHCRVLEGRPCYRLLPGGRKTVLARSTATVTLLVMVDSFRAVGKLIGVNSPPSWFQHGRSPSPSLQRTCGQVTRSPLSRACPIPAPVPPLYCAASDHKEVPCTARRGDCGGRWLRPSARAGTGRGRSTRPADGPGRTRRRGGQPTGPPQRNRPSRLESARGGRGVEPPAAGAVCSAPEPASDPGAPDRSSVTAVRSIRH